MSVPPPSIDTDMDNIPGLLPTGSSGICSSANSIPFTTPRRVEGTGDLTEFYKKNNFSPPKGAEDVPQNKATEVAQEWLSRIGKDWAELDNFCKAKFLFLMLRDQASMLQRCNPSYTKEYIINEMYQACCNEECRYFEALEAFVRKGGDEAEIAPSFRRTDSYGDLLRNNEKWGDCDKCPTIFNNRADLKRVTPLLRFQKEESYVCYMVSVAACLYYSKCMQTGTKPETAVALYAINVSKYMRNMFTNEHVYNDIFARVGSFVEFHLKKLLQLWNKGQEGICSSQQFFSDNDLTYAITKHILNDYGPLLLEKIPVFKEWSESSETRFGGTISEKTLKDGVFHAVLVVGVHKTDPNDDMGGIEFLIQDSSENKPFVTFGFNLLKSMGVKRLLYICKDFHIDTHWEEIDVTVAEVPRALRSGSPKKNSRELWTGPHEAHDDLLLDQQLSDISCDEETAALDRLFPRLVDETPIVPDKRYPIGFKELKNRLDGMDVIIRT